MQTAFAPEDPARILGLVAASLVSLGIIWRYIVRPPFRFFKRIEKALVSVEKELRPNGGSSLRDAVDRIEVHEKATDERLTALEQWRNDVDPPHKEFA